MKKTLLFAGCLLFSLIAQAQSFHLEDANDASEIYLNGDMIEVGKVGSPGTEDGVFRFKVRNNSDDAIKVQAKLVDVVNGKLNDDGKVMALQFCFTYDCYVELVLESVYPTDGEYLEIQPGATHIDNAADYIANYYEPENGGVVDYTFRFFEINDDLEEIGDPLLISYRYNPTLSTPDFEANFALLQSTVLTESLDINLDENASLKMYDMLGREVLSKNLASGAHHIALPNLSSNMYFVQLSNKEGAKQTFKVMVK